jgi:hypothetical protein
MFNTFFLTTMMGNALWPAYTPPTRAMIISLAMPTPLERMRHARRVFGFNLNPSLLPDG